LPRKPTEDAHQPGYFFRRELGGLAVYGHAVEPLIKPVAAPSHLPGDVGQVEWLGEVAEVCYLLVGHFKKVAPGRVASGLVIGYWSMI